MRHATLCCLLFAVVSLAQPAVSVADGGGNNNSAGDNQYVDPLAGTAPKPKPAPRPATTPKPTSSGSTSSTPPVTTTTAAPAAGTASHSTARSGRNLPYTGMPAGLVAGLGAVLLAAGVALRRTARAPR